MTAALAFVDTETTGLDPRMHEVWEIGLVLRDSEGVEVERHWQLPVDLGRADPMALSVGRFYERSIQGGGRDGELTPPHAFARHFAELTHGAHLVGAVPSFDDAFLKRLLRIFHQCPGWNYHLVDVENLVAGRLGLTPPWNSNDLSRAIGVDPDNFERHTALGDVRWAMALYDAVMLEQWDASRNQTGRLELDEFLASTRPVESPAEARELLCVLQSIVSQSGRTRFPGVPTDCFCKGNEGFQNAGDSIRFIAKATLAALGERP